MKYGDKGDDVRAVQRQLLQRGYDMPRYGADGQLGDEGWDALQRFAQNEGIPWAPEVPPEVLERLHGAEPHVVVPDTAPAPDEFRDVGFFDLVHEQHDPHPKSRHVAGKTARRAPSSVTGVTIHQTAVVFGATRGAVDDAHGKRELAIARRSLNVACHMLAFDGFYAQPAPLDWYLYHGNGFNAHDLGLEIEGLYPGLPGGKTWGSQPATKLTASRIRTARAALHRLVTDGRKLGMPIRYVHAHRQTSDTRRSDPGAELWKAVVLDYAVPVLGLKTEPAKVLRDGRPVPRAWDPDGVGEY